MGKLKSSVTPMQALAPAEALLVSSSPAFYELHDSIKFFILACFYRKLLKKRRPHSEREPTNRWHMSCDTVGACS